MGAFFYSYSTNNDVFMTNLAITSPVNIAFLESLTGADALTVFTNVGVSTSETIQYFMSFDDVINYFHFGKGVGDISIGGACFADCKGNMKGVNKFFSAVGAVRGKVVTVSVGDYTFSGPVVGSNMTIVSEPMTMANFSVNIAMTNHTLRSPENTPPGC